MPTVSDYDDDRLLRTLGMRSQTFPGDWASDFAARVRPIYLDRVAALPWVPVGWAQGVAVLHGQRTPDGTGWLLLPANPFLPSGALRPGLPAWLDTPDKRQAWSELAVVAQQALQQYAAQRADAGRVILAERQRAVTFWTWAERLARVVAAPVTLIEEGVKQGAQRFAASYTGGLALLGLGLYLWLKTRGRNGR